MAGFTNTGKAHVLGGWFRNETQPTYAIALCTGDTVATAGVDTLADLTQVPVGNGYSAGAIQLTANSTDFDVITEDDASSKAYLQIKDVVWTASGGPIPISGNGALYAVLTEATTEVTTSRGVFAFFSLSTGRSVSDGQTLTITDMQMNANES